MVWMQNEPGGRVQQIVTESCSRRKIVKHLLNIGGTGEVGRDSGQCEMKFLSDDHLGGNLLGITREVGIVKRSFL